MLRRQLFAAISLLTLTACATQPASDVVMSPNATPSAAATAQADPPPGAAAQVAGPAPVAEPAPPKRRQAAAGRAARAPDPPPEASTEEGPFTITKAREQCWMKYETEKAGRGLDLDKKAGLVQKCVDDKMNASIGR